MFEKIKIKLFHWRVQWFGDKELYEFGKMIPCERCFNRFKSYCHYRCDGDIYDSMCPKCVKYMEKHQQ